MPLSLTNKKVLMVVAPENFRDEELVEPRKALEKEGAKVVLASTRPGLATGMLGLQVKPDLLLEHAKASDYDGVVVVGGIGSPEHLWGNMALHALLKDRVNAGKVVGAICLSGAALARAGVAKGKRITCWPSPEAISTVRECGAVYEKYRVVVDGRIVTADGPPAAREFGEAVVRALSG